MEADAGRGGSPDAELAEKLPDGGLAKEAAEGTFGNGDGDLRLSLWPTEAEVPDVRSSHSDMAASSSSRSIGTDALEWPTTCSTDGE
eukprot:scaffold129858_cov27-Tisochrysis_lutea.AAC.2